MISENMFSDRSAVPEKVTKADMSGNVRSAFHGEDDGLSAGSVRKYLDAENRDMNIEVAQTVTSTNAVLKRRASCSAVRESVLIAEAQTEGIGSRGRSFFSPAGTGLYLSVLLRPSAQAGSGVPKLTAMAAVAVCEAVNDFGIGGVRIKWVNDILINEKKVCGILVQSVFSACRQVPDYVVVGVGINVYEPETGFPTGFTTEAGAIFGEREKNLRSRLAAGFINRLMYYYRSASSDEYVRKYGALVLAGGREITVTADGESRRAAALGTDSECRLRVKFENGEEKALFYGEVSIKIRDFSAVPKDTSV